MLLSIELKLAHRPLSPLSLSVAENRLRANRNRRKIAKKIHQLRKTRALAKRRRASSRSLVQRPRSLASKGNFGVRFRFCFCLCFLFFGFIYETQISQSNKPISRATNGKLSRFPLSFFFFLFSFFFSRLPLFKRQHHDKKPFILLVTKKKKQNRT